MFKLYDPSKGTFKGEVGTCSKCGQMTYVSSCEGKSLCKMCLTPAPKTIDPLFDENFQKHQRQTEKKPARDEWYVPKSKNDIFE